MQIPWPRTTRQGLALVLRVGVPLFVGLTGVSIAASSTGHLADTFLVLFSMGLSAMAAEWVYRQSRRMAAEKAELSEQLLQSQKLAALGELAAGIAHEINNPLAIIGQESELLQNSLDGLSFATQDDEEMFADSLSEINQQVHRCGAITAKMLDMARKRQAVPQALDINHIVRDMVALTEKEASRHAIEIITTCAGYMPLIYSDPPLIKQVVLNLLNNAIQAIGSEGTITVITGVRPPDGVCIVVRDTGCGISKEDQERIFNPFYTTKPPGKGTGLGLSISLRIIDQLGGSIAVQSEPGQGAAFTVKLPVGAGKEASHHGKA
ncbi:MAG: sensor histidine kinase [Desulfovibrio sp.]|uniref:sensor histidine kinase n=1 Tax=Desulfovibrio sp. 7SRBS1 TaxID=3378064 RepID=UPI003B3F9B79